MEPTPPSGPEGSADATFPPDDPTAPPSPPERGVEAQHASGMDGDQHVDPAAGPATGCDQDTPPATTDEVPDLQADTEPTPGSDPVTGQDPSALAPGPKIWEEPEASDDGPAPSSDFDDLLDVPEGYGPDSEDDARTPSSDGLVESAAPSSDVGGHDIPTQAARKDTSAHRLGGAWQDGRPRGVGRSLDQPARGVRNHLRHVEGCKRGDAGFLESGWRLLLRDTVPNALTRARSGFPVVDSKSTTRRAACSGSGLGTRHQPRRAAGKMPPLQDLEVQERRRILRRFGLLRR